MQEDLTHLIALQNLDWEIRTLSMQQQELPARLSEAETQISIARQSLEEELQRVEELKSQQRQLDEDMAMLDEGITRSRQRLMEIKDNFEYKAMLREIAFKEDRKDQKETEILRLMEVLEEHNSLLAAKSQEIERLQKELQGKRVATQVEMDEIGERLQALEAQRSKILGAIPKTLLKKYDFIRQRRNGIAIAEVRQSVCQVCHMNIPPQQFIELQREEEILTCPHCQRIIYWMGPEANGAPPEPMLPEARESAG